MLSLNLRSSLPEGNLKPLFGAATPLKARESREIMYYDCFASCKVLLNKKAHFYCENFLVTYVWVKNLGFFLHLVFIRVYTHVNKKKIKATQKEKHKQTSARNTQKICY